MKRLPATGLILLSGCATVAADRTLAGRWGGDQIALEVSAEGHGNITLSCATAEFAGPVKLDIGGHFLTRGTFTRGTGVATLVPPSSVPANISGRIDPNGILWLDVATSEAYPIRSARLRRGAEPLLTRCL